MSIHKKYLFAVPVLNFLVATWFGMILRTMIIQPMPFNFKFITHAHSHVAILGWVYMALFLLLTQHFTGKIGRDFQRLFWITEISVIGMIVGFPTEGYGTVSIVSSSVYILFSYIFSLLILKKIKGKKSAAYTLLRTSIVWLCLSTISLWALGPIIVLLGSTSKPALLMIQYFLHFQLNGWFLFAIVALVFKLFKIPDSKNFRIFHRAFVLSLIFTFSLPINWYYDFSVFRWLNNAGIVFQLIALVYGSKLISSNYKVRFSKLDRLSKLLLIFATVGLVMKIVFQSFSLEPEIARNIFDNRHAVIGFIHLMMLGIISAFILFMFKQMLKNRLAVRLFNAGVYLFLSGIILTELILLYQGLCYYYPWLSIPDYRFFLWIFSFLLLIGIYIVLTAILNTDFKKFKAEEKH